MQGDGSFETCELPNGFKVAWQRTPTETIFANLRIDHGSLHEKEGEEGIAHFLEHLFLFGGTEKHNPEEHTKILDQFGYSNAFTSRDSTCIPGGFVASDLESYLDITSQMAFTPRLDSKVTEQQREIVLREIARIKGTPDFDDMNRFYRPTLARDRDHTYFVLGKESVVRNSTEAQIRTFHGRGYSPNNMCLMLAGKIPHNLGNMVEKYFGTQLRGAGKPINFSPVAPLEKQSVYHSAAPDLINKEDPSESNTKLLLGVVVPDEWHPESAAFSVANEILGGSQITGLQKSIRNNEGMSYDIGCSYDGDERFGNFRVHGKIDARRQDRAIDLIFEEFKNLMTRLVDKDNVESAKRRVAYAAANYMGQGLSHLTYVDPVNVGSLVKMNYGWENRPALNDKLAAIACVSPEDVRRVAEQYLPSDRTNGKYVLLLRDPSKKG